MTRAPSPSASSIFLRTVYARAYPRLVSTLGRERSWMLTEIALPLLGTIAMVYVYQALHAPRPYLGFVVLGGCMLAYWQNVLWSMATQFYWDRDNGTLELYVISPTSLFAVLLGMAFGGIVVTTARAAVVLATGSLLFGVAYEAGGVVPALGAFVVTLIALYCLGSVLAALFLFYGRDVWNLSTALQEPVYFVSGFYFPVRSLTAYVGGAASLLPLTLGLDAVRQLLLPGAVALVGPGVETLVLAAQVPFYAWLAVLAFRKLEEKARREGRLVLRGA